jgi:hypothetical protein
LLYPVRLAAGRRKVTMNTKDFRSNRTIWRQAAVILLMLLASAVNLAEVQAQQPTSDSRSALVKQKLLLLESLLNSGKIKQLQDDGSDDTKAQLSRAKQLRDEARSQQVAGDVPAAEKAVDEALRTVSTASAAVVKEPLLSPKIQLAQNAELATQVRGYSASIADALKKQGKRQDPRLGQLERMLDEAGKLTAAGRHGEANRLLTEAYRLAVATVSELRAGETVVIDLKFDTPADEYAYEQSRNRSHEMLVEMTLQEGRADGEKRDMVERYVGESRQLRTQAEVQAKAGDYRAAIKSLEEATKQLVRALRATGMAIF